MNEKVKSLTSPLDNAPLECDGLTRVFHRILTDNRIRHTVKVGRVEWGGKKFTPHFWIELPDGNVVDYRLRMWLGKDAPHGVFDPDAEGVKYVGSTANMPLLSDFLLNMLAERKIARIVDRIAAPTTPDWVSVPKGVVCTCPKCGGRAKCKPSKINPVTGNETWDRYVNCPMCGRVDAHRDWNS